MHNVSRIHDLVYIFSELDADPEPELEVIYPIPTAFKYNLYTAQAVAARRALGYEYAP